jgi:hypothetical protein
MATTAYLRVSTGTQGPPSSCKSRSQRRRSLRLSASRLPPFTALSRQGGYAHILKGYFYTNLVGTPLCTSSRRRKTTLSQTPHPSQHTGQREWPGRRRAVGESTAALRGRRVTPVGPERPYVANQPQQIWRCSTKPKVNTQRPSPLGDSGNDT